METMVVILHTLTAFSLIAMVLLQRGQGADMGVAFGGGSSQTLFGSSGGGSTMGKITGALAATFMITSLLLGFAAKQQAASVTEQDISTTSDVVLPSEVPESAMDQDAPVILPGAGVFFDPNELENPTDVPTVPEDNGDLPPAN